MRHATLRALLALSLTLAFAAPARAADPEPPMQTVRVAPNTHYVQGLSQLGSPKNQNFISNAGFVVTPAGVVVVDALGSPRLAERPRQGAADAFRAARHQHRRAGHALAPGRDMEHALQCPRAKTRSAPARMQFAGGRGAGGLMRPVKHRRCQ